MRETVELTHEQARRMGAPRAIALCEHFSGSIDCQTGHWPAGIEALQRSVDLYEDVGSASGKALSLEKLAMGLTVTGKLEEAREMLFEALVVAERAAMRSHCETRIYASLLRNQLASGDTEAVRQAVAEGLAAAARHGHCVTCNAVLLPQLVRGCLATGDLDAAEEHARALEAVADEFQSAAWVAMARHARARIQLARNEHEPALASFEEARATYERIGQRYDALRCELGAADTLRAAGDEAAATSREVGAREALAALGTAGIER